MSLSLFWCGVAFLGLLGCCSLAVSEWETRERWREWEREQERWRRRDI